MKSNRKFSQNGKNYIIFVVRYIKYNSIIPYIVGCSKLLYDFLGSMETIGTNRIILKFQRCFSIGMFFNKQAQSFSSNDSHGANII